MISKNVLCVILGQGRQKIEIIMGMIDKCGYQKHVILLRNKKLHLHR